VNIVGTNESSVKEALQRFKNLQTIYNHSKPPTSVVSCIHMPSETEFAIYFCSLDRFAHRAYVDLLRAGGPYCVLLSVLKDDKGDYQKPKDLLDVPAPPMSARIAWMQAQKKHSHQQRLEMSSMQTTSPCKPATSSATPLPKSSQDDFPALPSAPRKAPPAKGSQRRVVRELPERSGRVTPKTEGHVER
jgi:hypothetical protein